MCHLNSVRIPSTECIIRIINESWYTDWRKYDVSDTPVCRRAHTETLGVARYEPTRLHCDVDANPDDVTFTWRLNGSTGLAAGLVTSQRARSVVTYTPTRPEDYGMLLCQGSNGVGVMSAPCAFLITPSGETNLPYFKTCSVIRNTLNISPELRIRRFNHEAVI